MCGRYTLICIDDLGIRFRIYDPTLGFRSKFNVAPGQSMPVIIRDEHNKARMMQWGLVSGRAEDYSPAAKAVQRQINVRAGSLLEKPVFQKLLAHKRCLIPASGFYEWKKEGNRKVPFYFSLEKAPVFAFAGLYDLRRDASGIERPTYTIITTRANDLVAPYHDRMPAIVRREDEDRWLSGSKPGAEELNNILAPYPADEMKVYLVSSRVNRIDADDENLIRPLATLV